MNHHRDHGSVSDFDDPASWNVANYNHHPCEDLEPVDLAPNGYRAAALYHLQLMYAVDEFITAAEDARLAVVAVAVMLQWPSVRGLSINSISNQLGCSLSTITRACTKFREMSGLAGGVRFIRPGAGSSNGDKPAAVQA
jgi:hypothetical protein